MLMMRAWGMPSANTFDCIPISEFVRRYLDKSVVSIDPFARNRNWATFNNDINPTTTAEYHLDARDFLRHLSNLSFKADLVILDPPYSPRQIVESYKAAGLTTTLMDTQNARLYREVRDLVLPLLLPKAFVLSFGWNSAGMGKSRGFEIEELLLVNHGGAHNDTICLAERKA